MRLGQLIKGRDNNFNLIRIIAALTVICSHSFGLRGALDPIEAHHLDMTMGTVAVDFFFIASGFLVTASLLTKQSALDFIWARFLRIYPALIVMVILCIFLVGLYFTTLPPIEFLTHRLTRLFAIKNTTLFSGIMFNLPGVSFNSPPPYRVNSPIWTLFYEVWMYAALVFMWTILYFLKSNRVKIFSELLIWVAIAAFISQLVDHFYLHWYSLYLRLFYMFFSGAAYFVLRDKIIISNRVFWIALIGLLVSTIDKQVYFVFYNSVLAYLVFWLAYIPDGRVRQFNQFGDYSYGMYIYAYPMQQTICTLFASIGIVGLMSTSTIITFLMAYLSWHLIEKKALSLKRIRLGSQISI